MKRSFGEEIDDFLTKLSILAAEHTKGLRSQKRNEGTYISYQENSFLLLCRLQPPNTRGQYAKYVFK